MGEAGMTGSLSRADLERLAEAAFELAAAKRRMAAINDANVHLKTHHELVEIEKMMVEARVARLKAEIKVDGLVEELARLP
jgi:hypothetical protein